MKKFTWLLIAFLLGCAFTAKRNTNDMFLIATLYQSHSAEYKALCLQAYNSATIYLDKVLDENRHEKPMAIVVDIDETVLNNIAQVEQQIIIKKKYEEKYWDKWVEAEAATPIAGAREFLAYAKENGIETFYITNRIEEQREQTLANLKKAEFPFADDEHLIMKDTESSKEKRREILSESHDIIILCGDNLSDFSKVFDEPNEETRDKETFENSSNFGTKWIVLPNPTYGNWLNTIDKQNVHKKRGNRFYRSLMKGY